MDKYYRLLKDKFPTKAAVLTEIINLEAIQLLPKGTEFFISDLHGEFGAFDYLLRNGSGILRRKMEECFENRLTHEEQEALAQLMYFPKEKIARDRAVMGTVELQKCLHHQLPQIILLVQYLASKYTRSKVRKLLPPTFSYIIEELLAEIERQKDKEDYVRAIVEKVTALGSLEELIIALSSLVQELAVDHLHVVGDIYDRGPSPDLIMERLLDLRSVDIQWGNHDITWMGAMAGSLICMVNVIRIAARYNNLSLIEDSYGINLRPLISYCQAYYQPLPSFTPILDGKEIAQEQAIILNQLQQATAVLQFKLEDAVIARHPEWQMEHRRLLRNVSMRDNTVRIGEETYPLKDFTTVCLDNDNPCRLSSAEESLLQHLMANFQSSEKLKRHIDFLFEKGSMYLCYNDTLLYHGCIPLTEDGGFKSMQLGDKSYAGKALLDAFEDRIRTAYYHPTVGESEVTDVFWYLWTGECSSLFGKEAMTTFERYYISDRKTHQEKKNTYYHLRDQEETCHRILRAFGLSEEHHIVNGHTPVREIDGENPIKANGRLLVIDGGFAKGYQQKTGRAGYTLVSNSFGLELVAHLPFQSITTVLNGQSGIMATKRLVEEATHRKLICDTTIGQELSQEILDLEWLYRNFEDY
ncbi:fructose-1,6-bisphosphatase [Streptococcus rifensis]